MKRSPLTPTDLEAYMQAHGITGEILRLETPTPTVETAAQAVGTHPENILKSILFLVGEKPVLAISSGLAFVERRAIAALYGVGRKRVRLAAPGLVSELTGYEVGAMPPFGHRQALATLLDRCVLDLSEAYAGGGAENALLHIAPVEILRVTGAQVLDLMEREGAGSDTDTPER
jgi:prolyl-tRNA editing enzyme YbaK/EbsC (Cys-tRNA(Pro) deacylase)